MVRRKRNTINGNDAEEGQTQDTNSHFLCQRLYKLGVKVGKISTISDGIDEIASEVKDFSQRFHFALLGTPSAESAQSKQWFFDFNIGILRNVSWVYHDTSYPGFIYLEHPGISRTTQIDPGRPCRIRPCSHSDLLENESVVKFKQTVSTATTRVLGAKLELTSFRKGLYYCHLHPSKLCRGNLVKLEPESLNPSLIKGELFIKWDEDLSHSTPVILKVDKNCFFLSWTGQCGETNFLDISLIRDTRTGVRNHVDFGSDDSLEDRTVRICYGNDFVNVRFVNFSCRSKDVAKIWCDEILKVAYNLRALNGSVKKFLKKAYTRLLFNVDRHRFLQVSYIEKRFASHEEDRRQVEQVLQFADVRWFDFIDDEKSMEPKRYIESKLFTLKMFYQIYRKLTVRPEVDRIFAQICEEKKKF
ncbi:hypothetical protein QYM36_010267 [Artemia franciscana]|uniref:PLC-beta PH domain-containing protein n=1 Tax=Artemia franciscana TaxID=6661 RepID=A0AA88L7A6_ARTSF|nr:hypothetical protein QYM36_010267 [Artemia franciscana]